MLLKVVQEFEDKYTKEIHKINATINVSKARGDELLASTYKLVEKDIMNIDSEVDPDADEGTTPDADEETTPDADEGTTPDADEETTPDADEETTPDADEETTPDADEETTPDADEETTPDADDKNISEFSVLNFQQLKKICVEKGFDVSEINTKKELLELLNK